MSTAVELHHSAAVPVPQLDFNALIQVSQMLAKSSLVPGAYRGKPENVLLASLAGQAYGWDPTLAMRSFHIIDGQPSLKAETQLALVRRAGHSVDGDTTPTGATITGIRRDTGDKITVNYTLEDAKRANLLNKDNWKKYPHNMCWNRAVSQLCRMLFPDVVLGAGYTPEELGATVDADGEVVEQPTVVVVDHIHHQVNSDANPLVFAALPEGHVSAAEAKRTLIELCGGDVERAKALWGARGSATIHADVLGELLAQVGGDVAAPVEDDIYEALPKLSPDHKPTLIVEEKGCDY